MRYLTVSEALQMYRLMMEESGGTFGILSLAALESALAQPRATFDGNELHPGIAEKAAALGFSLIMNHAFLDGNKRLGHIAMESFLSLNGHEIDASVDEQEKVILHIAKGELKREGFADWLKIHIRKIGTNP